MCGKTIVGDYLKSFKHPVDNAIHFPCKQN